MNSINCLDYQRGKGKEAKERKGGEGKERRKRKKAKEWKGGEVKGRRRR